MGAPTIFIDTLETLENGVGFQSLLRFLAPALFGDLPDTCGHSGSFKAARLRRSLPFRDHEGDIVVRIVWKRHMSGRKLKGKMI